MPSEYGPDRDRELLSVFDRMLQDAPVGKPVVDVMAEAGRQPASRFYIGELRAIRVLRYRRRRGEFMPMSASRRRLYTDLHKRVEALQESHPGMALDDAIVEAVNSPAPEFYMEPESLRVTLYGLLRRRRAERRAAMKGGRR